MKLNGIGLIVGYYTTALDQRRMSEHVTITPREYLPAVITSIDDEQKTVNLQLMLDGPGYYYVKGATEGTERGQFVSDFDGEFFEQYDNVVSFDLEAVNTALSEEIEKRVWAQVPALVDKAVKAALKALPKAKDAEPAAPAAPTTPAQ